MGALSGIVVLQVTPRLNEGGVERATVEISRALRNAGAHSLVASAGGRLEPELAAHGAEFFRMPAASKNPLVIRRNAARLVELIREHNVSLVHARSRAPAWSAYWACRQTGTPFVTTYHGIYSGSSGLKKLYNSVMARGDIVIANSNFTCRHLLDAHEVDRDRVVTIERGVDLAHFADPSPERIKALAQKWGELRGVVFLLAARLTSWKGQELAIEALRRVEQPCTLILAGEGKPKFEARLRAMAPDNVKLVGHVDDMAAAYALADFVLVPSLDPEAFGRTAVEPQAMGRPVLAARHGAPADTVVHGETGWLVEPRSPDAWAAAMTQACLTPPEVRRRMGAAGRERVRRYYSIDRMCDETLDVYARLTGAQTAPRDGRGRSAAFG